MVCDAAGDRDLSTASSSALRRPSSEEPIAASDLSSDCATAGVQSNYTLNTWLFQKNNVREYFVLFAATRKTLLDSFAWKAHYLKFAPYSELKLAPLQLQTI